MKENKYRYRKIGPFIHCLWNWKMVKTHWKADTWLLVKNGGHHYQGPEIALLGIHPREIKNVRKSKVNEMKQD